MFKAILSILIIFAIFSVCVTFMFHELCIYAYDAHPLAAFCDALKHNKWDAWLLFLFIISLMCFKG